MELKEAIAFIQAEVASGKPKKDVVDATLAKLPSGVYSREEIERIVYAQVDPKLRVIYKNWILSLVGIMLLLGCLKIFFIFNSFDVNNVGAAIIIIVFGPLVNYLFAFAFYKCERIAYVISPFLMLQGVLTQLDIILNAFQSLLNAINLVCAIAALIMPAIVLKKLWPDLTYFGRLKTNN